MNPAAPRWAVEITFGAQGVYRNVVAAASAELAYQLALQDARMGSPSGSFTEPVTGHTIRCLTPPTHNN